MATHGKRRALGQHFLKDQSIARTIAETAVQEAVKNGCTALLEIGPGRGAITAPLRDCLHEQSSIQEFIIAERDPVLIDHWKQQAPEPFPYRIAPGDFLETPESEWLEKTPLGVVSNLPYSVGTAIVVRLAALYDKIPVMVLMFQAEVARRLRADVDTREWGSLSIWIQNRWDVTRLIGVPPGAFIPPPEVDSEVVILRRRAQPRIVVTDEKLFDTLLRVCFAHRRKMLRSGLPASGPWRNALERAGVDGTKRAETLSWEEWSRLYQAVLDAQAGT